MKIDFRDFQLLDAVEFHGSFAAAADNLNRTRSAITQSIQKLEEQVNYPIFDRSSYRPTFTKEGRILLDRGRHILKQMQQLHSDLRLVQNGFESEFSIAFDDLLSCEGIYTLIKDFQKIAPNVSIRLHREVLNGTWDALSEGRATLILGAGGEPPPALPCDQSVLGSVSFVFAIAPHHPLAAHSENITAEDLAAYTSVVISDTATQLPKRSSGTFPGQPLFVVPNMDAKILAQVHGLGIGYLPLHRIEHLLSSGKLVLRSVPQLKNKAYLKMAWRTDTNSKILNWFLTQLENEEIRKKLFGNSNI